MESSSGGGNDSAIEPLLRQALAKAGVSILATVFWTVLAVVAVLVGLQTLEMAFYTSGLATVGLGSIGLVVIGSGLYLLYLLHR